MPRYRRAYGTTNTPRCSTKSRGQGALQGSRIRRKLARNKQVTCPACGGDGVQVERVREYAPKVCRDGQTRNLLQVRIVETPCPVNCQAGKLVK